MTQAISPARWSAVLELQGIRSRLCPGSFEFDIADHAIDLVLNDNRPDGPFLVRNALKDSRSVTIRRVRRERERFALPQTEGEFSPAETLPDDHPSPETQAVWKDGYLKLSTALEGSNARAALCLRAWLKGDEMAETASQLGISREYVKKIRTGIRAVAGQVFLDAGAA